jgi:alkanesulfonate monooxygenase SsuD/methylene tetrahydromethanopterin reductase-like flavin-dependent oxidoreductase (luciferase family)
MADTVDEISGGRLVLGLGSGYVEREYRAFGYPFDHRVGRFAEALVIVTTLLRPGRVDFNGTYYQARECALRPRGPRPAGPPILIGALGTGPRMLRLTAEHADAWNGWLVRGESHPRAVPALREAVDAACRAAGRNPATLERTVAVAISPAGAAVSPRAFPPPGAVVPLAGTPEELAAALRAFAAEGIAHIQLVPRPCTPASVEALAPVLALLDAPASTDP